MDRKWIFLVTLIAVLSLIGCSGNKDVEPPPPPPPVVTPPPVDVEPKAAPAEPVDPTPAPRPKSLQEIQDEAERAGLLGTIFFDLDKYDLRSTARDRLARNAEFMKENGNLTFTVEGHCDERGTNEYNLALGESRSNAAIEYLVSLGVERSRLTPRTFGEERPVCTENNEECWQRNRRAYFVVSGQ